VSRVDPELDFTGKTVLVTGSGRNIGRAIAIEFAGRGANVIINSRSNRDEAEAVAKEAQALGARTLIVMGAAGELSTVEEMKHRAEQAFGRVDIYVSNAAGRFHRDFFETSNDDWHFFLNQQLTASWYLAKAFVPGMIDARWGRIIHINGPDGYTGGWMRIPHSTAKGGLRTLTKSLAAGLGEYGITVNDINPGFAATIRDPETHPGLTPEFSAERARITNPIRRQPTVDEIAWACVFLCSRRAGAITGSAVHVDGGRGMLG
jgi:NAD(P)-dependent dehydrogenase (short-subunit alcohol dehydrogenase family)